MRFQQLVFRTTPHSLVEWLDGELEKRGIDCVYTHCILSILQEDSDDTESDECIDVRNNQQKVYHKYGGPESLFSATKSKHQKWKTYSKQILLTGSIPSCDVGISDLERKNRNAAINCLKSVSEDNTIEDLIDEVCLKLKNIKNMNALEKKDSVKSLNRADKETAFYIPPSSPTDQVEKYFAAFPPLNNNFEERSCSNQLAHLNAWYNNCIKNKNIVQDIFKNSQMSSDNGKNKIDNTYCSLKSIENIYKPENKTVNRLKVHNITKQDGNYFKFSDENAFTEISIKSNCDGNVSNSTLTNMLSKFKNESKAKICDCTFGHLLDTINATLGENNAADKCKNFVKKSYVNDDNTVLDSKKKTALPNSSTNDFYSSQSKDFYCKQCKVNALCPSHLLTHKCLIDETSKPIICTGRNLENVSSWESLTSDRNKFTDETPNNPCKKFKSLENSDTTISTNVFSSRDLTPQNIDVELSEENEDLTDKKILTSCPKSKRRKKSLSKDNSGILKSHFNQLIFSKLEKAENKRKDFECSEEVERDNFSTSNKPSETTVEPLKRKANTRIQKSKSALKKCCSSPGEKNLEFLKPKCKSLNVDARIKNVDRTEVLPSSKTDGDALKDEFLPDTKETAAVKEILLSTSDSLESEDKDYGEMLPISQCTIVNTNKTKQEIYFDNFDKSNVVYFSIKNGVDAAASDNTSNKVGNINKNAYTVEIKKSTPERNFKLPVYNDIPRHKLIFPFGNINLIKIGTNMYYDFNPLQALSFFSEHEIFNIITAGDLNEVNNFLTKFSSAHNVSISAVQDIDFELKHNTNNCPLPSQETSNFDSRKNIDCLPLIKVSSACPLPKFYCSKLSTSSPLKDFHFNESDDMHSSSNKFGEDVTYDNTNAQKPIVTNDNASVLFGNWDYNLFFDFYKAKTESSSDVDPFPFSDSFAEDVFPEKQICHEDTCNLDISHHLYNDECNVSQFTAANTNNFVVAIKQALYDFEEKYLSHVVGNEYKLIDSFYSLIRPKETNFENACDVKVGSAFIPASKVKQSCVPGSSKSVSQNLLGKAVNIDRIIQKINGKNRVASYVQLQNKKTFTEPSSIWEQIRTDSHISILNNVCNYSDKSIESENFMPSDTEWSKQFLVRKENLKSIWEPKINSIGSIWGSPAKDIEKQNSPVSSNNADIDAIHQEFEKEQEELLRGLYSMPHLKEETDLPFPLEQNISNQIFESPYKSNVHPTNESLNVNPEEYTEIPSVHTMPAQTESKFSQSNNNISFPTSVPHIDPIGTFSLENCKSDAADLQITCSDNYSNYIKNESYQESDFIDLSAFQGPYGSFNENRTEGGGWSLDSDTYLLESDAFHDQSSSLHDLNSMGSENESLPYMQIDKQQFLSEDEETTKINATRWPTGYFRRRMKHKCQPFKRPCAFYMEGHCNRIDCKFSHELSNITCRFWLEGSCFKGSTCPFLHGYVEEQKMIDPHRSFHKREPERNYSLDSEADFPSLASSKCEKTLVAKSEPVDIVRVKGFKNTRQTNH